MESLRLKLTELCEEHETLRGLMLRHAAVMKDITVPGDAYIQIMITARTHFREVLHAHAAAEDDTIASAFQQTQPEDGAALARIFPLGMRGVLGQYDRHIARWTEERILADWFRYRESVLGLQRQLAERMAWEEREVYLRLADDFPAFQAAPDVDRDRPIH